MEQNKPSIETINDHGSRRYCLNDAKRSSIDAKWITSASPSALRSDATAGQNNS